MAKSRKPAALPAVPSGIPFEQWIVNAGLSKSSAYKYATELGIKPAQEPDPGNPRIRRAWLSDEQARKLSENAKQRKGRRMGEALDAVGRLPGHGSKLVPVASAVSTAATDFASDADIARATRPLTLLERMQALDLAIATRAPLSTDKVGQLLGARPGGDEVARGGVLAVKQALNCWILESIDG